MLKRAFDLFMGLILLVVLAVPMLIIALIVRLTSRGPALFWSDRVGIKVLPGRSWIADGE